ncbi:MAG: hypothetical protein IT479_08335 [Xanthomonadales bacterium]|nr:hypothetical protein [Xanthomonadales bacterium]
MATSSGATELKATQRSSALIDGAKDHPVAPVVGPPTWRETRSVADCPGARRTPDCRCGVIRDGVGCPTPYNTPLAAVVGAPTAWATSRVDCAMVAPATPRASIAPRCDQTLVDPAGDLLGKTSHRNPPRDGTTGPKM